MTLDDILKHCRENFGAFKCIIPFRKEDGSFGRLEVINPYFDEEKAPAEMLKARDRILEAPKALKKLSDELLEDIAKRLDLK